MSSLGIMITCVFLQVALTIWSIIATGYARITLLKKRELHFDQIALNTDAYPENIQKLQNNTRNQFELPTLFYAAVAFAAVMSVSNWLMAVLAEDLWRSALCGSY